nr:hypothetical protein [Tanacetum cinerariifolium]
MAWQTDNGIMKEGMSILKGRKSVPGMNSREKGKWKEKTTLSLRELHDKELEPMAWQTDNGIMKEGMSILKGRKSVPGMNSREKGKWKEKTTLSLRELHDKELV